MRSWAMARHQNIYLDRKTKEKGSYYNEPKPSTELPDSQGKKGA